MIKQVFAAFLIALPACARAQAEITSTIRPQLPVLSGEDADAVTCRPPMELPGRRLLGPKVCRPQREWDELHKQGLDLGPDGKTVVGSEKYRTIQCGSAGC